MARAGHSDFATTQGYIDLASETFREEAELPRGGCSGRNPGRLREPVATVVNEPPREQGFLYADGGIRTLINRFLRPVRLPGCATSARGADAWTARRRRFLLRPLRLSRAEAPLAVPPEGRAGSARTTVRPTQRSVRQSAPRANSEISCGVAVSKPTTSSMPGSFGSAIENPFETSPTTTSRAGMPDARR